MNSNQQKLLSKQFVFSFMAAVVLTICLCITTYALVMVSVSVPDSHFQTGKISINLNDGEPVIEEHEFIFEPGMTVTKEFFIENRSTWAVYYKLYLDELQGGLATVLDVTIQDQKTGLVLFEGKAANLSKQNVQAADDTLTVGERRNMEISFHYPENAGNTTQNMSLSFTLCAEAVQTKNNSEKRFD